MKMIQKRQQMKGQSGFTLIELLVAIAILGVLAGVAVFAVGNLTSDSKVSACTTEGSTLITAAGAATATADAADTANTFIKGGTASLDYFNADGSRKNTTEVDATKCPAVTL
jgi:prepilin-type N-terminal cleavage/methylation domain-containing protein